MKVMRSTMGEFRNNDDYLDMWLAPSPKPRRYLSQYGTRRMFYALRQTITAKTPQAAGETVCCQKLEVFTELKFSISNSHKKVGHRF